MFLSGARGRVSAVLIVVGTLSGACQRKALEPGTQRGGPRVASAVVAADEILWELGGPARKRVVAVSAMADDGRYSGVAGQWPSSVGRLGPDVEQVLALEPSTVIVAEFSNAEYRAALEGHVDLVVLDAFDGFAGYATNVAKVAGAVDADAAGVELIRAFENRRRHIAARAPQTSPSCASWGSGFVAGGKTTFDDAITLAGCTNAAAAAGIEGHREVDAEQFVLWNPAFVVIDCAGDCEAAREAFEARPGFSALDAVLGDHVIAVPSATLTSVGGGMLDLAQRVQEEIDS